MEHRAGEGLVFSHAGQAQLDHEIGLAGDIYRVSEEIPIVDGSAGPLAKPDFLRTAVYYGVAAAVTYTREFVPLLNDPALTDDALAAARTALGPQAAAVARAPLAASEDFARFLAHVPGCFVFLGNGEESAPLHNPTFDFDAAALPFGAAYHVALVRRRLPVSP